MRYLLINQYASNKGDRAVLYALCTLILRLQSNARITVSTSDPSKWEGYKFYEENQVKFIPYAWDYDRIQNKSRYWRFLKKYQIYTFTLLREAFLIGLDLSRFLSNPHFYHEVKLSDVVISVGGHHFTTLLSPDIVSSINFDACVAVQQKRFFCFSQSFGPFSFRNNRNLKFTKRILGCCQLLFPREDNSFRELINFGINPKKIIPTQETVIYLNRLMLTFQPIPQRKKRIGISIYSTQRRTESQYQNYISSIAGFCDYTVAKGFEILFFPMEMKDASPDDRPMIKCIMDHVHDISNIAVLDEDLNTVAHLKAVSECQLFVGHKTHSTIFSLTTGTPLIGIAYHPKTIEFMKQYGVENYAIKESELTLQRLIDKFNQILPNLSIIGESCFKKSRMIADGIEDGFMQIMKQCN